MVEMMKGINPAWANLPRRKCDDCGKSYKPTVPLRPNTRGFCSDNCRKSYHKHGGAYRKLRTEMVKMIAREFTELQRVIAQCAELREEVSKITARLAEIGDGYTRLDRIARAPAQSMSARPTNR